MLLSPDFLKKQSKAKQGAGHRALGLQDNKEFWRSAAQRDCTERNLRAQLKVVKAVTFMCILLQLKKNLIAMVVNVS